MENNALGMREIKVSKVVEGVIWAVLILSVFPGIVVGGESSDSLWLAQKKWRWGLEKINAPEAWECSQGEGIIIAVIDGGIDFSHPGLRNQAWINEDEIPGNGIDDDNNGYIDDTHGWDFIDDDAGSSQGTKLSFHGTFMANIAAGKLTSSGQGGVAPRAKIMDVRIGDSEGNFGSWRDFNSAFEYALDNEADVINISLYFDYGTWLPYSFRETATEVSKKIFIVGIGGNENSRVQPLAVIDEVVAVTAIDRWERLYSKANQGPEVAFSAPGVDISFAYRRAYGTADGTSYAAPHLTGTVALMLSVKPELSPEEVYDILKETSKDLGEPGRDEKYGYGLIDAHKAVLRAQALLEEVESNHGETDTEKEEEISGKHKATFP